MTFEDVKSQAMIMLEDVKNQATMMLEDVKMTCSCSAVTVGLAVLTAYIALVQLLRFRRVRAIQRMDVKADPSAVYRQTGMLEFPFLVTLVMEFAQFRAYGVPSISKLLHKTGEFCKHAGKRFDDTDLLFREYLENDTETNRSKIAVARINAIHDSYSKKISNADMLYTICLFITEPPAWIDRYEWRRCTDIEKEAFLGHFVLLGERMGIKGVRDWKTWDDAVAFQRAYEAKFYFYHESNNAIAVPTIDLFISKVPESLKWAARWAAYALMDPLVLKTMGLPQVPTPLRWAVSGVFFVRAMLLRFLALPRPGFLVSRRTPFIADDAIVTPQFVMKPRYEAFVDPKLGCLLRKDGYTLGELGPEGCPAGRLVHDVPIFTGDGGGGSGSVVLGPDGKPLDAASAKKGN